MKHIGRSLMIVAIVTLLIVLVIVQMVYESTHCS
jgi:hypothetical protein